MKKTISILVLAVVMSFAYRDSSAQKLSKTFSFGIGLEGGITTGDTKDFYPANGGLTLRGSYHVGPGFVTLTSGAIAFIPKDIEGEDVKAGLLIPVRAGYKYIIKDHFFVMGELGYGSFKEFFSGEDDELASDTQGGFLFAPSVGAQFGVVEISLRYESVSLSGTNLSLIGLRLGFNF